jgi:hypothetical protein
MKIFIFFLFIIALAFLGCEHQTNNSIDGLPMSRELFIKAINNSSTSPNLILVNFIDSAGHKEKICTQAGFLLGAIHIEYEIPYDELNTKRVEKIALNNSDLTFTFKKKESQNNIRKRYTLEILNEVKEDFKDISTENILNGNHSFEKYLEAKGKNYYQYRDAVGYLLLERDILPGIGCIAGNLFEDNREMR